MPAAPPAPASFCCCVVQAVAYIPPHQAHLIHAMARWVAAVMWVVKALVRQGAPLREELTGVWFGCVGLLELV